MISYKEAAEILSYDQNSGVLRWKVKTCKKVIINSIAGTARDGEYVVVRVNKRLYYAHRLAWLLSFGSWPNSQIDHKDHNRSNNRLSNLRLASASENQANRPRPTNNTTGVKGVIWDARKNKFVAQLREGSKHIHVGYFDKIAEAKKAVEQARTKLHREFACHD
jgi:hypothetical protein